MIFQPSRSSAVLRGLVTGGSPLIIYFSTLNCQLHASRPDECPDSFRRELRHSDFFALFADENIVDLMIAFFGAGAGGLISFSFNIF